MLSKKLESYGYGSYKGGQPWNQNHRFKANYFQQKEVSADVVDNSLYVAEESSRASTVDANCSHRANRKRKLKSVFSAMELTWSRRLLRKIHNSLQMPEKRESVTAASRKMPARHFSAHLNLPKQGISHWLTPMSLNEMNGNLSLGLDLTLTMWQFLSTQPVIVPMKIVQISVSMLFSYC